MADFLQNIASKAVNSAMATVTKGAPRHVISAIEKASANSGVDFAYLIQQARAESSFNPEAKAKTSSASGLFQFIESTWLSMVDKYGDKYGIDKAADKQATLDLRNDPEIASQMAAEFAGENQRYLDRHWGGDTTSTDLYFAHFLGARQAAAFLNAHDENPMQSAAALFPKAANANKNVFFDRETGKAKSLAEVYAFFDKKFETPSQATEIANASTIDPARIETARIDYQSPKITPIDQASVFNQRQAPQTNPLTQNLIFNQLDLIMLTQINLPQAKTASKT